MDIYLFMKLAKKARDHVVKYAPEYPEDLCGACGCASLHLMRLANQKGFNPTFVAGYFSLNGNPSHDDIYSSGHCWIIYNNIIVDITATQFSNSIHSYDSIHVTSIFDEQYCAEFKTNCAIEAYDNIKDWASYPFRLRFLSK